MTVLLLQLCELPIDVEDFVLGVADLTGELMRFSINAAGRGDVPKIQSTLSLMRRIYGDGVLLKLRAKDFNKKMEVMQQSIHKVENGIVIIVFNSSCHSCCAYVY